MNWLNQRIWALNHWFLFVAPVIIAFDLLAASAVRSSSQESLEAGLIFDFVILIPALYFWCYRHLGKRAVVRAVVIGCCSIWLLGHLIPQDQQQILGSVNWLRYLGLAGLVAVEIKAVVFVWRSLFRNDKTTEMVANELEEQGTPAWVSKLLALEGMMWKHLWQKCKSLFGRK